MQFVSLQGTSLPLHWCGHNHISMSCKVVDPDIESDISYDTSCIRFYLFTYHAQVITMSFWIFRQSWHILLIVIRQPLLYHQSKKKKKDWSKFLKHETLTVRIWHFEMIIVAVKFLKVSQIGCYMWLNVIVTINEKKSWIFFDQYKVEPLYTMIIFWSKLILNIWGSTSFFL